MPVPGFPRAMSQIQRLSRNWNFSPHIYGLWQLCSCRKSVTIWILDQCILGSVCITRVTVIPVQGYIIIWGWVKFLDDLSVGNQYIHFYPSQPEAWVLLTQSWFISEVKLFCSIWIVYPECIMDYGQVFSNV